MQEIPTDGSYYDSHKGCGYGGAGCTYQNLVRKLTLDRSLEGAHVFLCRFHWDKEMQHRQWQNDKGISEPWDVFDFFETNPALEVVVAWKAKDELPEIEPHYTIINYVAAKDVERDVFISFMNMSDVLVSMRYQHKIKDALGMPKVFEDAREHMLSTRRLFGLISVFENTEDPDLLSKQRELCDMVFEAVHMYGREVLKYA